MRGLITGLMLAALALPASALAATQGERVKIKGEVIDTWCYFSGVMGGPESVLGSAHHTCALWCAAGGIPVGVLAEDGTVYMVLKYEGDDHVTGGDTILEVQSDLITADGLLYERDGINYLVVETVTANDGLVNLSHEDYDVIPPFAIPKPKQ
ncbi:MAG: hypothetical protein MI785_02440 [Kiloniellales bacterium]|nr:hypothetical protein [Kiloniellales bacterium]